MLRPLSLASAFLLFSIPPGFSQSPPVAQKPASASPAAPGAGSAPASAPAKPTAKKQTKKVWTNDDISSAGGAISVVGGSNSSSAPGSSKREAESASSSARDRKIDSYRRQLHELQNQLDDTNKKLAGLRNFNGDNASGSGGINIHQRYSMTPVADQIKQLEEKKKQLENRIDSVQDSARKDGIEPGDLR